MINKKKILALVVTVLLVVALVGYNDLKQSSIVVVGESIKLTDVVIVCSSIFYLNKFNNYVLQNDQTDQDYMLAIGTAVYLPIGTVVKVVSFTGTSTKAQITFKDDLQTIPCYANTSFLK